MIKAISLLLVFFVLLALFGRLRFPRLPVRRPDGGRCRACGRPAIGQGRCPCGKDA